MESAGAAESAPEGSRYGLPSGLEGLPPIQPRLRTRHALLRRPQREHTISLNQLHAPCNSRIQYRKTCPQHGEVKSDEIVTGYEFEEGRYVIVDAGEIDKIRPPKEKGINVSAFIADGSIDARYFTGKNYHLLPDGPIARTPYALLQRAMADGGRAALCELVMRTRKNIAVVRPLGNLLTMSVIAYDAEMKGLKEFEDDVPRLEVSPAELKLATQLIDQMSVDDADLTEYQDDYEAKLQQLIEAKIAGKEIVEQPAEEESPQVINLMEVLQRSIAQAKRPAGAKPPKMVAPGTAGKAKEARKRKTS
jgi:DNA end-binding protein Ku